MESHGLVCEAPEPVQHANMTQAALEEFFTKAIEAGFFKDISGVQFPTSLMSPDSCVLSFLHVHLPSLCSSSSPFLAALPALFYPVNGN
jgi:hypothetical protein